MNEDVSIRGDEERDQRILQFSDFDVSSAYYLYNDNNTHTIGFL